MRLYVSRPTRLVGSDGVSRDSVPAGVLTWRRAIEGWSPTTANARDLSGEKVRYGVEGLYEANGVSCRPDT